MGFVNAQHHDSAITSHKRRFTAGKVFCALSAYPSLAPTLAATKLQCLQSFAFSRIVGITQGAAFQISFSRSATYIYFSSTVFHGMIDYRFLGLTSIPLPGWTTAYPLTY